MVTTGAMLNAGCGVVDAAIPFLAFSLGYCVITMITPWCPSAGRTPQSTQTMRAPHAQLNDKSVTDSTSIVVLNIEGVSNNER